MKISLFFITTIFLQTINATPRASIITKITVKRPLVADSLANIYLDDVSEIFSGKLSLYFGSCEDDKKVHKIGEFDVTEEFQPDKFSWYVPSDAQDGCFFAKNAFGDMIAQSGKNTIQKKFSKRDRHKSSDMYFNAVYYHKSKSIQKCLYASSKSKKIGIIGAGISGLFSGYLLDQAGFNNYEILEASDRIGGRIHTVYFDKSKANYQEMGAMRIPFKAQYNNQTFPLTDHQIVFQLVEELNTINDKSYKIEFIKWYNKRANNLYYMNGFRRPDGSIPTVGDVQADPSIIPSDPGISSISSAVENATSKMFNDDWFKLMAEDLYAAHKKAIDEGYDDWSEWSWLHNKMGLSLNATDYATAKNSSMIWGNMYHKFIFTTATDWVTVKDGLSRIPQAFEPLIGKKIKLSVGISKIEYNGEKVSLQWKESPYDEEYRSSEFDNVIVTVPFSIVRTWHLPKLEYTLQQAIKSLGYSQACKVALEFKERFWEQLDRPIQGGCDFTDMIGGGVCYPVNDIGTKGPGVVLAGYSYDDSGLRFASMSEDQHVARVIEDFTELHGANVKKYYTGKYVRHCSVLDPFQSGSWALPTAGQHKLYMPSYFKMDNGLVFVGEHTDIKHSWISGSLESAIRGVVMVLVENGHIDEAKDIIKKYNATWMTI